MSKDAVGSYLKNLKQWHEEAASLRDIILDLALEESLKWGKPCYSHEGKNIAIIQPFKACLGLMFFKGTLLKDPKGILVDNGPNSQAARRLEFRSLQELNKAKSTIKAYIKEAIALEEAGQTVAFKKQAEARPAELEEALAKSARFKKAFESLTPGRQRAYVLHISQAKQAATRLARIEKCKPRILEGKGLNDV